MINSYFINATLWYNFVTDPVLRSLCSMTEEEFDEWAEVYEQFFAGYPGSSPDAYRPLGGESVDPNSLPKNNDGRRFCFKCGTETEKKEGFNQWWDICPKCGI